MIKDTIVTFFGWEVNAKKGTLYFRSSSRLGVHNMTFDLFDFSDKLITAQNLAAFTPDSRLVIDKIILHRYLLIEKVSDRLITLKALKDASDSHADNFQFQLTN